MNKSDLKIRTYNLIESLLGEDTTKKYYLRECIKRYEKASCVFIHIPKCAGTSITSQIFGKRVGHFTAQEVKNEMKENFDKFYSFSVTRDPLSRIYSAYCYIKNNGGTHGGVKHEDYYDNKAFRSFDSFIQEWLAFDNNINKNILFVPQNKYILDQDDKCMLNAIFKIENKKNIEKKFQRS